MMGGGMVEVKKRNVFLTIWLWLIILLNLVVATIYFTKAAVIHDSTPSVPILVIRGQALLMIVNVICAIAILHWYRWGFWGLCLMAFVGCVITIHFLLASIPMAIAGNFFSVLALYFALNRGGVNKAWLKLK
jgi:hypothetical protein